MEIPAQLILFSIPSLVYVVVQRRRKLPWGKVFANLGWRGASPIVYLWGLGITAIGGGAILLALQTIPPEVLEHPNVSTSAYATLTPSVTTIAIVLLREAFVVTLGEEVFFRGLVGGWLTRRFSFIVGNTIQAVIFLLPHLLLLLVSLSLWPVTVAQFVAGWLLGWLRYRSGSILPGWCAHTLANLVGAWTAMR